MSRDSNSQFSPSWFFPTEVHAHDGGHASTVSAYVRLWRVFMRARVFIACVLLALQVYLAWRGADQARWTVLVCFLHLLAATLTLFWSRPAQPGRTLHGPWLKTIAVDLLAFGLLDHLQQGGINYTALFALPVLLAAVLGSITLALGTAAVTTLYLLADVTFGAAQGEGVTTALFLQAALSGTGFFVIAFLANQLAQRLAREEVLTQKSQAVARTQAQVNELIIESLSEGVLVVDRRGAVKNANPAALSMLLSDPPHDATLLLSARKRWGGLYQLVNHTFSVSQPQEAEVRLGSDQEAALRVYVRTRLTGANSGQSNGLCVLFLEDLREVEARVRTEKLASMGRMSAAVAHEIRNPLSAIAQANALLDEEVSMPAQKRLTQMIEQNALRLARIVDDILNVARAQTSPDPLAPAVTLDLEVRQITQEWAQQHSALGVLSVHLHAAHVQIAFEPEHLRRVLINLLDNALRHASSRNASIRVITQTTGNDRVRLSVWSDGAPLEPSVQKHLFEPFFSSQSRSSGLGLFLCRELCERYGAQIAYQRRRLDQQEGNEFYVLAPALPNEFKEPAQQSLDDRASGLGPPSGTASPSTRGPSFLTTV